MSVLIETLLTMDGKKSFAVVVRVASKEWIETVVSGQTKASLIIGNHWSENDCKLYLPSFSSIDCLHSEMNVLTE